jgi:hypothetical protein
MAWKNTTLPNKLSDFAAVFWRDLAMSPVEPIMADQLVWLPRPLLPRGVFETILKTIKLLNGLSVFPADDRSGHVLPLITTYSTVKSTYFSQCPLRGFQ